MCITPPLMFWLAVYGVGVVVAPTLTLTLTGLVAQGAWWGVRKAGSALMCVMGGQTQFVPSVVATSTATLTQPSLPLLSAAPVAGDPSSLRPLGKLDDEASIEQGARPAGRDEGRHVGQVECGAGCQVREHHDDRPV